MKILLLSDSNSEHTEKWAVGLADKGHQVGLFSFNRAAYDWYNHERITVFFEPEEKINAEKNLTKLAYLKYVSILKKILKHFEPDILHAHYATSYGLVGALSHFHPFVISCWGTDVMKFPQKNFIAKSILKYNFKSADLLCATSYTIENYISNISNKPVTVIPFGVDVSEFKPKNVQSFFEKGTLVIGSVKPLEQLYNCHILIRSFAQLAGKHSHLRLLVVGDGSEKQNLIQLCEELQINDRVLFTGRVPFDQISNYFNAIDILANLSEYESFGVCVVEAMACEKPVVVTNTGGLREIVSDDKVGLKVAVGNVEETVEALDKLIVDEKLREQIGASARDHVLQYYDWNNNLDSMIEAYEKLIN
jgi:L-malate glycosyltransferase